MKNRIAIYSALALLIVSSGLFAQEAEPKPLAKEGLQFSGGMFTGVRVVSDSDMSTAQVWHDDVGNSWKLGILYETEVGGAKARLQWKRPDLWDNNGYTTWDNFAYGWVNMFGGLAVLSAGMIDDGLWGTGNVVDSTFDNVKGLRLEVKPMDGLSLGFAIPIILGDGSRDGDGYNKKYQLLALPFMNMDFGAKYGTDAFTVVFGLKLSGHDGDTTTWDKVDDPNTGVAMHLGVDVPLGAITANLTAFFATGYAISPDKIGGGSYDITQAWNGRNMRGLRFGPKVSFAQDAISAYAQLNVVIDMDDQFDFAEADPTKEDQGKLGFEAQGKYKISELMTPHLTLGSDNMMYFAGNGLWVKVGLDFSLGHGISASVYDKIDKIGTDADKHPDKKTANIVQLNFAWEF